MRSAHTVEQVRDAEKELMARLPQGTLMQRAATGLAYLVLERLGHAYGSRALLLVGAGNNGGDALYAGVVLARRGVQVEALLLSPDRADPSAVAALRVAGGRVVPSVDRARRPDVVVDGILGIGGRGGLREDAAAVVDACGDAPVVAVDTPSGVEVDSGEVRGAHVRADATVTFGSYKVAHLADPAALACGAVRLVDIGLDLPAAALTALEEADVAALLPRPSPDAQKYTRGVVGVRAGSQQYPGAGVLCVSGASTGLAGMVRYLGGAADLVRARHPEVVVGEGRVQAWVIGSGGGADAGQALAAALADRVPVVVDADGLSHVAGPLGVPALLTPHAGELARMLGVERSEVETRQLHFARLAAERYDAVVLLKGRHTLVATPAGDVRVTTVGPSWLATAGSGDVLAGLCGSLVAAGLDPFDAGSVGSWLHGAAADAAGSGGPVTAPDVAAALPALCRRLLGHSGGRERCR